jgi:hypothetical protein
VKNTSVILMTLLCFALGGCTTGQANTTPPVTTGGGPGNGGAVLQMSLGSANFAGLTVGMNVLETFRGANGASAVPITTATLTGPPGFAGPKHSKDPGSGKTAVPLGSASNQFLVGPAGTTTVLAGADGFGIGPPGCSCAGINFYPFQPQFADATQALSFPGGPEPFYGGPPAYPPTVLSASALSALVQIPSSWPEGFYFIGFKTLPPAGRYSLTVSYSQGGVTNRQTASAAFRRSLLPALNSVSARSDHKGGIVVHVGFPTGVKQVLVNVIDANVPPSPSATCITGLGFATLRFDGSGTQSVPDGLGNYGKGGARTFCKGDLLNVQVLGFDYDDFALGPPGNTQQRPALPAHADVTYATVIVVE